MEIQKIHSSRRLNKGAFQAQEIRVDASNAVCGYGGGVNILLNLPSAGVCDYDEVVNLSACVSKCM